MALAGIFAMLVSGSALAADKDTLTLSAASPASANGVTPTTNGTNLVYAYTRTCSGSVSDTLHVTFKLEDKDGTSSETFKIHFKAIDPLSGFSATLPADFLITDNSTTNKIDIPISASSLAPGVYLIDFNMDVLTTDDKGEYTKSASSDVKLVNPKKIQVEITVNECTGSAPFCFFTDSEGDFLADCNDELVSTNEGGTFMLVNKKTGVTVATNPGQFYYNYLWTNTGNADDFQILPGDLEGLEPKGANAVHAYTFGPSGFTQNTEAFDMVNNDGEPCGPYGPCTVHVGEGETLWVTWHLAYSGVGSEHPDAGDTCQEATEEQDAGEEIAAEVRLENAKTGAEVAGTCTATATGYNKN